MSGRVYLLLFFLGLGCALSVAAFQSSPGYMDADYYYAGALRLATGHGFSEQILWNYLDNPAALPHPSHAYWMPLVSILAALGMKLGGAPTFAAARLGFLILAGLVPVVTAGLSFSLVRQRNGALLAGLLAAASGFYLPYLPTTDAFGLYMLAGGLFLLLVPPGPAAISRPKAWAVAFLLGLLAGCMHLTRADGMLWLFLALLVVALMPARFPWKKSSTLGGDPASRGAETTSGGTASRAFLAASGVLFCLLGYLIVMGPWLGRNLSTFGTVLSPGGGRALWLASYDELFIYPASLLTPQHWLSAGITGILKARLWAAGLNLQTFFAVQSSIVLAPLILLGLWRLRLDRRVQVGVLAWLLTFFVMTLVFPYQGARGGFFHSGAALQPFFWAVAPLGLCALIDWAGRLRGWNLPQARLVFGVSLVGLVVLLTIVLAFRRVGLGNEAQSAWNQDITRYVHLEQYLESQGAQPSEGVLVNNSPGFFIASERPSISIPYGDVQTVLEVARRYQARYLLLEFNQLTGVDDLYANPGDRPGLNYMATIEGVRVYQIIAFPLSMQAGLWRK